MCIVAFVIFYKPNISLIKITIYIIKYVDQHHIYNVSTIGKHHQKQLPNIFESKK